MMKNISKKIVVVENRRVKAVRLVWRELATKKVLGFDVQRRKIDF